MITDELRDAVSVPSNDSLKHVAVLAEEQIALENMVNQLKTELKLYEEKLRFHSETVLPDAMVSLNLKDFSLSDGSKISIRPCYGASIPKETQQETFAWLEEQGFGGLIKTSLTVPFERTAAKEEIKDCIQLLQEAGFHFDKIEGVHPQSLKAFAKEQIEQGKPLPEKLFNTFVGKKATIKKGE